MCLRDVTFATVIAAAMRSTRLRRTTPAVCRRAVLPATLLVWLALCPAQAAAQGTYSLVNVTGNNMVCSNGTATPSATASSALATCTDLSQGPSGVSGWGSSAADYGVLRALAISSVSGPQNGSVAVDGRAGFIDSLSVAGPGTGVFLKLTATILGTGQGGVVSGGSGSSATYFAGGVVTLKAYAGASQCAAGYVTGGSSCTILVPVNASGVVDVSMDLQAQTAYSTGSAAFGSATANFYDGGLLSGAVVTDASGNPLAGYSISAASGTSYPVHPPSVATYSTHNYVRFFDLPTDPSTIACSAPNGVPCSGSVVAPGTNWTVNYFADARADYGILRAKSSIYLTGDNSLGPLNGGAVPFPSLATAGGLSSFREGLWVSGGQGTGTMYLTFTVTGTSSQTPGTVGWAAVQYIPIVNGRPDFAHSVLTGVAPDGTATVPVPFTFNQLVEFQISFYALSQIYTGWTAGASVSADYSNTAVLSRIAVKDGSGLALSNFSIATVSGTPFGANGVVKTVPIDVLSRITLTSHGVVPVAVLSDPTFNAPALVDVQSLTFGRTGNEHSLALSNHGTARLSDVCEVEDVNDDGLPDLVCRFSTDVTAFQLGDTVGVLKGWTLTKKPISGSDRIRVGSR
jgi:hypothetical protein